MCFLSDMFWEKKIETKSHNNALSEIINLSSLQLVKPSLEVQDV